MHRHEVVDWRIRCNHDSVGGDDPAVGCLDPCRKAALDRLNVRSGEDASSGTLNCPGNRTQVHKRVKLRLARKSQARPCVKVQ